MPALAIVISAIPRYYSGLRLDAAFPVPVYMVMNYPASRPDYLRASRFLAAADPGDGDAQIASGEAAAHSGAEPALVVARVRRGLSHAPASARGWTLLSEELTEQHDYKHAAEALSLALVLGPYDYSLAERRAGVGATLFGTLSSDDKRAVENQVRLLWESGDLRDEISVLASTKPGDRLLTASFSGAPEQIREINRWLASRWRERGNLP